MVVLKGRGPCVGWTGVGTESVRGFSQVDISQISSVICKVSLGLCPKRKRRLKDNLKIMIYMENLMLNKT